MPAYIMTMSDVSRRNAALSDLSRTGRRNLLDEHREGDERRAGKSKPGRCKIVSWKELEKIRNETSVSQL